MAAVISTRYRRWAWCFATRWRAPPFLASSSRSERASGRVGRASEVSPRRRVGVPYGWEGGRRGRSHVGPPPPPPSPPPPVPIGRGGRQGWRRGDPAGHRGRYFYPSYHISHRCRRPAVGARVDWLATAPGGGGGNSDAWVLWRAYCGRAHAQSRRVVDRRGFRRRVPTSDASGANCHDVYNSSFVALIVGCVGQWWGCPRRCSGLTLWKLGA